MKSDLQFSYKVADFSNEICAKFPVINSLTVRSNLLNTDERVKNCSRGLSLFNTYIRTPVNFFNDIQNAATAQVSFETVHMSRINTSYVNLQRALNNLYSSGALNDIGAVASQSDIEKVYYNLKNILDTSESLRNSLANLTSDLTSIRSNITTYTVMTPNLIRSGLDENTRDDTLQNLQLVRSSVDNLISTMKVVTRTVLAHSSIFDAVYQANSSNILSRDSAIRNFNTSYNRALNEILSVARVNNASAFNTLNTFVSNVRRRYNDDIVRPAFESTYFPEIMDFVNLTVSLIYDLNMITASFQPFQETVLSASSNSSAAIIVASHVNREKVLDLQKTPYFTDNYSTCIDDLVSALLLSISDSSSKINKCVNERTSGVNIILPTLKSALGIFRDNFNFVMAQLNSCIAYGSLTVNGLLQTAECLENVSRIFYRPNARNANLYPCQ